MIANGKYHFQSTFLITSDRVKKALSIIEIYTLIPMTGRSRTYKDCFPSRERLSCSSLGMRGTLWSLDLSRSLISVLVAILLILNEVLAFQNNGGSLSNFAFNQRPLKTCPMGHVLVEKPEGFKCMKDFSSRWRPAAQTTTTQRSWGNGFSGSHSGSSTRQPTTGFGFQEPDYSYGRIEYEKKSDDGSNDNR